MVDSSSIAYIAQNKKQWKRASRMSLAELDESISKNPRDAAMHCFRAVRLVSARRFSDALEALKLAAELAPGLTELRMAVGYAHQGLGNPEDALREFEGVLELHPRRVDALCAKGEVLADLRRTVESLETMDLAASIDPYSPVAHEGMGLAQRILKWDDYGLAALKRAAALDPKSAPARAEAGFALMLQGRDKEALAEYDEAIRLDSNYTYARALKSTTLYNSGRHGDALAEAERALSIDGGNPPCRAIRALAMFALDRRDEALEELRDVVDRHPEFGQAQVVLGLFLMELGQHEESLEHFELAMGANPRNAIAHEGKICALWNLQRTAEGDGALETALALNPTEAVFYAYKGHICQAAGKVGDAQRLFARARELDPTLDIQKAARRVARG